MAACDRAGYFRAEIVEYGLKAVDKSDSKSVAISFRVLLTAMFENGQWVDWSQYEMDAYGDSWIVKKDGTLNERAVNDLVKHCGWDGQLASVVSLAWKPTPFQVEIKPHVYNGETSYRVEWINAFDSIPGASGAMGNVDDDKLRELEARFGAPLRALQGNIKRGASQPASRPAPPPPKAAPVATAPDGIKF